MAARQGQGRQGLQLVIDDLAIGPGPAELSLQDLQVVQGILEHRVKPEPLDLSLQRLDLFEGEPAVCLDGMFGSPACGKILRIYIRQRFRRLLFRPMLLGHDQPDPVHVLRP